jgi:hypothetical protein
MRRGSHRFFVLNTRGNPGLRGPKQYEIQLLDEDGRAKATAYCDSADEELVMDGVRVDRRVLLAAMAQADGKGTYVDETGSPTHPF